MSKLLIKARGNILPLRHADKIGIEILMQVFPDLYTHYFS